MATLAKLRENGNRGYVHCTAGLGRAPGVGIAYLYWFRDMSLDEAYSFLTSKRVRIVCLPVLVILYVVCSLMCGVPVAICQPCGPKREAIRGATYDLVTGGAQEAFDTLDSKAFENITDSERLKIQQKLGVVVGSKSWMDKLSMIIPKL